MKGKIDCPCGCGLTLRRDFRSLLESIEKDVGFELYLTSGARCQIYNATITKNRNSAHTLGAAADVALMFSHERYKINQQIFKRGIKRTGRSGKRNFTHIDIATGKVPFPDDKVTEYPQEVDWDYD